MLESIDKQIRCYVQEFENSHINNMMEKISSGKMLRSSLVINISENKADKRDIIKLCAIIEMIQLASLLHDDVIDNSSMRRGKESINALYGSKSAIMLGDILYSKAYYHLSDFPLSIAKSISNAVCLLSMGEIEDVHLSDNFNDNANIYLKMCENKTASLIAASSECAAILCGLKSDKYKNYGNSLGIAFQLIDDILDITQSEAILGKPSMNDYKEGKTTMPYIYLYEYFKAQKKIDEAHKLRSMFKKDLSEDDKKWIKDQMMVSDSIQKSISLAKNYGKISLESLKNENQQKLEKIVNDMINREF